MNEHVRVALAQYLHDSDPVAAVAEARRAGADIVVFPESFSNGLASFDPADPDAQERWCTDAQTVEGEYVGMFRRAAREQGVHVVATFLEAAKPLPFNSALLIAPDGCTVLHHRKVYVCDFDFPECATAAGGGFAVGHVQTTAGPLAVGLMICMDREYPEPARALSRSGAEIALVPNCCDLATDLAVGDVRIAQMRGRAFENVMGIAVANYPRPRCDGHSLAVDATGNILVMAGEESGLVVATFDLSELRRMREVDAFRWRPDTHSEPRSQLVSCSRREPRPDPTSGTRSP